MATQEMARPSLAREIRERTVLNRKLDREWYYSDINSYEQTFVEVLGGVSIHELLKNKPFPVVLDLMGSSSAIASSLEQLPGPKLGVAVSLEDRRNIMRRMSDKMSSVKQIRGDISRSSTWDEIEKHLQGHKADLIIERAGRGVDYLPRNPNFYAILLNKAWSLQNSDNGVLLAQVPDGLEAQAAKMIDNFKNINEMDASIGGSPYGFLSIKIVKTPNSPIKLPFSQ